MKLLAGLLIVLSSAPVFAADSAAVLKDPTVVAISKLMNDKHAGKCVVPSVDADVKFYCMGALPTVTEATPVSSGCMFDVEVKCSGETARIGGYQGIWMVVFPENTDPLISSVTADGGIRIQNITFTKTP